MFVNHEIQTNNTKSLKYFKMLLDFLKYNEGVNENGSVRNIEITNSKVIKKVFDLNNFMVNLLISYF